LAISPVVLGTERPINTQSITKDGVQTINLSVFNLANMI
jgi:hypothetical protein